MQNIGPCMCGADDCCKCFPNHFDKHGCYIDPFSKSSIDDEDEDYGGEPDDNRDYERDED
jgi:hypothetical protein